MKRLAVVAVSLVALAGCASSPLKKDTKLAPYTTAIVKDLVIDEDSFSKIEGDEITELRQKKPELVKLYTDNLKKYLMESEYFTTVSSEKTGGKAIIVESKTTLIDPGIRMVMPSRSTITVKVSDADTKEQLGLYSVYRQSGRQIWTTMMGTIKKDITDLGEDAGSDLVAKVNK